MADLRGLVSRERTPLLYDLVHGPGASGVTRPRQEQIVRQLEAALEEARQLGRREGLRLAREAVVEALGAAIERLAGDDRETLPAPEPTGGTAA